MKLLILSWHKFLLAVAVQHTWAAPRRTDNPSHYHLGLESGHGLLDLCPSALYREAAVYRFCAGRLFVIELQVA